MADEKKEQNIEELLKSIEWAYKRLDDYPSILIGVRLPNEYRKDCEEIYGLQHHLINKLLEELSVPFLIHDINLQQEEKKQPKYTKQAEAITEKWKVCLGYTLPQIVIPNYQELIGMQRKLIDELLEERRKKNFSFNLISKYPGKNPYIKNET